MFAEIPTSILTDIKEDSLLLCTYTIISALEKRDMNHQFNLDRISELQNRTIEEVEFAIKELEKIGWLEIRKKGFMDVYKALKTKKK